MSGCQKNVLEIQKLTLRFGGLTALKEVNLRVVDGQIVSIIGPNGAGKTSLFNIITGIYPPSEGKVLFYGKNLLHPLTASTLLALGLTSLLIALGSFLLVNIEDIWKAVISNNYVYRQSFSWAKASREFYLFLVTRPFAFTVFPFIVGFMIAAAGFIIVWRRTRRSPEYFAQRGIVRTFQNIRLFRKMTVVENVLVGINAKSQTSSWIIPLCLFKYWKERKGAAEQAQEILKFVGLDKESHRISETLPYGSQRRLEIARALATKPRLLLLDEPAAGMNPNESMALQGLIQKIRALGISVLLIEHDMKVVMGISDHITVLHFGKIIAEGGPQEVRGNPAVIEAYLGKETATAQ